MNLSVSAMLTAIVVVSAVLILFAGTAYAVLFMAVLFVSTGLWVASEARWRLLLRLVWGSERSAAWADTPWTARYPLLAIVHGLILLGLAVAFFLFANIRLASL